MPPPRGLRADQEIVDVVPGVFFARDGARPTGDSELAPV
jgi:hypothetical protein